jgi:hypothetical protein
MRAIDPRSGAELWFDATFGGVHWESPIVVNGTVYATDESGKLWAWQPNAAAPLGYYTLAPCRLIDTRQPAGPLGGPAIAPSASRRFAVTTGVCGVPSDAQALAVNVIAVSPTSTGEIRLGPSGFAAGTTTLAVTSGKTRANNAAVSLTGDPLGSLTVQSTLTTATDFVLDVVGYFR